MTKGEQIPTFLLLLVAYGCFINHVALATEEIADAVTTPPTTQTTTTTQPTTVPTKPPPPENSIQQNALTQEQRDGIATLEFQNNDNLKDDKLTKFYENLRKVIAEILNKRPVDVVTTDAATTAVVNKDPGPVFRFRRDDSTPTKRDYTKDDIQIVVIDPMVKDDQLRAPVLAQPRGGRALPADELANALNNDKDKVSADTGEKVNKVYIGLPPDVDVSVGETSTRKGIWETHEWLFYIILILIAIGLIVLLLCCLCMRCRSRMATKAKDKPTKEEEIKLEPMVMVNTPAAMQERSPPPPPIDEENGWIIPMDQLSKEELEQPDVQISKL